MHRFFIEEVIGETSDRVIIHKAEDVKHLSKALRVKVGENLEICDGASQEFIVTVESIGEIVTCKDPRKNSVDRESPIQIDLFQGLAKGSKMETIIQKAVELGVNQVIPLDLKRSIVKLDPKSAGKKVDRWQKIADEASKQSKRSHRPQVGQVIKLRDLGDLGDYDLLLVAYENERTLQTKEALADFDGQKIGIFIGPEGGFEEEEIAYLQDLSAKSISLGPRILRTETAGMMLISILQYALGDV